MIMKKQLLLLWLMIFTICTHGLNAQFTQKVNNLDQRTSKNVHKPFLKDATKLIKQNTALEEALDTLLKEVEEDMKESLSSRDSLINEYYQLVDNQHYELVSPLTIEDYRERIDQKICEDFSYEKSFYKKRFRANGYGSYADYLRSKDSTSNIDSLVQQAYDSLNQIHSRRKLYYGAREYFDFLSRSESHPIKKPWWFPLKSIAHAEYFYFGDAGKKIKLLNNFAIQSNFIDNATASSEMLSGIIPFQFYFQKGNPKARFALPIKFDLGINISKDNPTDTTESAQDNISKLLYGGLFHVNLSYPVFYSNWKYLNGKGINLYIPVNITSNWEGGSGQTTLLKELYYFFDFNICTYLEFDLIQSQEAQSDASIFINTKMSYIDGGSRFYDQHVPNRKAMLLIQANAGIRIKEKFTIAVNLPIYTSDNTLDLSNNASLAIIINPN